jgi:hypothetical protein
MGTQTMQYAVFIVLLPPAATHSHNPPSAICPLPLTASHLSIIAQCPSSIARWQCLPVGSPRLLPALVRCWCSRIPGAARGSHVAGAGAHPLPILARCRCQCSPGASARLLPALVLSRHQRSPVSCIHCPLFTRGLNSVLVPSVQYPLPVLSARSSILLQTTKRYRVSLRRTT